jgi:hypothetical protein
MTTSIKDFFDLPERVHRGDFVLRLADGVTETHAEATLRDCVVTPQLCDAFDNALSFIRSAIDSRTSKAAYLHGSFGSGKSDFMAVLYLLLQGSARARAIPELADVVARHNVGPTTRRASSCPITGSAPARWSSSAYFFRAGSDRSW